MLYRAGRYPCVTPKPPQLPPMPTISFTVRKLESLKSPASGRIDYWDQGFPGFGLRISESGTRTWVLMYRTQDGRQRRLKIGRYGRSADATGLDLADAHSKAREALRDVEHGKDPAAARDANRTADTVEGLCKLYIEKHAKPNKRSWQNDQRMLNHDVIPAWGNRKAKAIRRRDVIDLLDAIVARGAPVGANRTYEVIRRMFSFAIERDIVNAHPCVGIKKPGEERQRERVLTEAEILKVWRAFDSENLHDSTILKLRLLTAQRGAEVRSMRWSDFDPSIDKAVGAAWWTIPGDASKNGRAHRVPLVPEAVALLKAVWETHKHETLVFPGKQRRAGAAVWEPGDRVRTASGVDFVPHDLRRTAASMMAGMGIPRLTISKILNHVEHGVTKIYDRHSYDREKREALEAWSGRLIEILDNKEPATNVVPLARVAG